MDYKSVFTNLCLELQQNRSWIKGLGKNPQKSELIHWRQCLLSGGAPKRVPSDSEKHRRVYTSSNVCHSHEWRVDTASGKTLKKRNACLHAVRQAVEKNIACIYGLRSEGVKTSKPSSSQNYLHVHVQECLTQYKQEINRSFIYWLNCFTNSLQSKSRRKKIMLTICCIVLLTVVAVIIYVSVKN